MNPAAGRLGRIATSSPGKAAVSTAAAGALAALSNMPQQVSHLIRDRYPAVAVTGMTGVGKTRLVDRLTRHTTAAEHLEVGSATMERRTRRVRRFRGFRFRVVPGDNAATRLGALDQVFHDEPVDGVLHVVAYGYATPRRTAGISGLAQASRADLLAAELDDWAITAHRIASLAVRRDQPIWLIVVLTKTDLFPDAIEAAIRYYSPGGDSPFAKKLDDLRTLAGGARLSVDVLPVSAESGDPGDVMLASLVSRMAQLSGHV
ncbi:GTPase [Skermania piniformis]|uniref:50S ribosome-binding GTPase n=1 Tax=Skermania pinensis TaxID=39122 RepID=A0ABX8S7X3_9ACTN|nr:GTPase [Skermania piniformis]QXQ13858.1 50S ribosome-binding GTPase [Skermania piniformis]